MSKVNDKFRVGTATITKIENSTLKKVADDLVQGSDVTDDETLIIDEKRYRLLTLNKNDDDVETEISYKLTEKNGSVYKLEITAAKESRNDQWVETFFDSFRVK